MRIERLGRDRTSVEGYVRFQQKFWPDRFGADTWEALLLKYFDHPDADCCPGSGIYACMEGDEILGVQAAYPFPVVKNGTRYAGHMLVDWGALQDKDKGPLFRAAVGGQLFRTLVELPGRKYASIGSPDAMRNLACRATRIPSVFSVTLLSPVKAALVRYAKLSSVVRPISLCTALKVASGKVEVLTGADLEGFQPTPPDGTFSVYHSPEFWRALGLARRTTGAVRLKLGTDVTLGEFILQVKGSGNLHLATLLSSRFESEDQTAIRKMGRILSETLQKWNVCALFATESDIRVSRLLRAVSLFRRAHPSEWWSIPRPSDTFAATEVKWWLTGAERDGAWAY